MEFEAVNEAFVTGFLALNIKVCPFFIPTRLVTKFLPYQFKDAYDLKIDDSMSDLCSFCLSIPEIFLEIISFLPQYEGRRIANTSKIWKNILIVRKMLVFNLRRSSQDAYVCNRYNIRQTLRFGKVQKIEFTSFFCVEVETLCDLSFLQGIKDVNLSGFPNVESVKPLCEASKVILDRFPRLTNVDCLLNVAELKLSNCKGILDVRKLCNVKKLLIKSIFPSASGYSSLINVQDLTFMKIPNLINETLTPLLQGNVTKLTILECPRITLFECPGSNLQELTIKCCVSLADVSHLASLPYLSIQDCEGIINWGILQPPKPLTERPGHRRGSPRRYWRLRYKNGNLISEDYMPFEF